jgi:hypothetical protein
MSKSRRVSSPGICFRASAVPTKKRRETNADPEEAASAAEAAIYVEASIASTGFFAIVLQRAG